MIFNMKRKSYMQGAITKVTNQLSPYILFTVLNRNDFLFLFVNKELGLRPFCILTFQNWAISWLNHAVCLVGSIPFRYLPATSVAASISIFKWRKKHPRGFWTLMWVYTKYWTIQRPHWLRLGCSQQTKLPSIGYPSRPNTRLN